jgi:hypothetical protein
MQLRFQIINSVRKQLNAIYNMFMKRNPNFAGNVSIFAHSLGSVIVYDLLTDW